MSSVTVAHLPTPLERADRLGAALALRPGQLWIKRDDCTGLATGGNKARKVELLLADALANSCDVLVTAGGPQSNHARLTAAAAARAGIGCVLAFNAEPPSTTEANQIERALHTSHLDPIGSCQASTPQSESKSAPFPQTPQTMLSALRMQWPRAFIFDLPAARLRA